jgi:hypothetical protein
VLVRVGDPAKHTVQTDGEFFSLAVIYRKSLPDPRIRINSRPCNETNLIGALE